MTRGSCVVSLGSRTRHASVVTCLCSRTEDAQQQTLSCSTFAQREKISCSRFLYSRTERASVPLMFCPSTRRINVHQLLPCSVLTHPGIRYHGMVCCSCALCLCARTRRTSFALIALCSHTGRTAVALVSLDSLGAHTYLIHTTCYHRHLYIMLTRSHRSYDHTNKTWPTVRTCHVSVFTHRSSSSVMFLSCSMSTQTDVRHVALVSVSHT